MKKIIILLLMPFASYSQPYIVDNLSAEMEIIQLYTRINPDLMDSPLLRKVANDFIEKWMEVLDSETEPDSINFAAHKGYMTICNLWFESDRNKKPLIDLILDDSKSTLVIKNANNDNMFMHIKESTQIGVSARIMKYPDGGPRDIYCFI